MSTLPPPPPLLPLLAPRGGKERERRLIEWRGRRQDMLNNGRGEEVDLARPDSQKKSWEKRDIWRENRPSFL